MPDELELGKVPVNAKKATPEQLRTVPLNSTNEDSVTKKILASEKKFKITIPSTEKEKEAVLVGINGVFYNIPRDKEVEVPASVVHALKNAVTMTYRIIQDKDADGAKVIEQPVARIPLQAVESTKE